MSEDPRPPSPDPRRDALERATEALRSAPIAVELPPEVLASTVAALADLAAREPVPVHHKSTLGRKIMFRALNAVAALIVVSVSIWLIPVGSTRASFADVQTAAGKAANVRFTSTQKLLKNSPTIKFRQTVEGRRLRLDMDDVLSIVYDVDARKGIQIQRPAKTYRKEVFSDQAARAMPNFVDEFLNLSAAAAERSKPETLDGRTVEVFRLKKFKFSGIDTTKSTEDDGELTVRVDPETKLPVKVELRVRQPLAKDWSVITMTDFAWNVDIPPGFFDVSPPAGFTELPPIDPRTGEIKPAGK